MKDPIKLKELILEKIEFADVLVNDGASFVFDPTHAEEVQLRCPFHGDDRKPSARFYRETQSMFCWVCKKRWDVIEFTMDRESANFIQALKILVSKYKIDTSSIPDDPEFKKEKVTRSSNDDFERIMFGEDESLGVVDVSQQKAEIESIGKDIRALRGKLPFKKYNALSGAYSIIVYAVTRGLDSSESVRKLKDKLQSL